jgi:hypothetical protein
LQLFDAIWRCREYRPSFGAKANDGHPLQGCIISLWLKIAMEFSLRL